MNKFLLLSLLVVSGCASHKVPHWQPYAPWPESREALSLEARQKPIPFPQQTPYDQSDDERGMYLHGFMTGWDFWTESGESTAGTYFIPPGYARGNEKLEKIWNEGIQAGQEACRQEDANHSRQRIAPSS